MHYFITGATGFIGRYVVEQLLQKPDAVVYAMVRQGSEHKLEHLRTLLGATPSQLQAVQGDLTSPALGLSQDDINRMQGRIDHFYHLAAIYDMKAAPEPQQKANVEGTRHALQAAKALQAGCFEHVSSIAVAGLYDGLFTEDMFEEGTNFNSPYFLTKHLAEMCVRDEAEIPYRIYRPSMVVGHSETGEMEKIDGPYYVFRVLEIMGRWLPRWLPIPGVVGGMFNIVPVDYVAKAMVHIAHQPGLDGQVFSLTDGDHYRVGELFNMMAKVANVPGFRWQLPNSILNLVPQKLIFALCRFAPISKLLLAMDIAPDAVGYVVYKTSFDRANTAKALEGSGIEVPKLDTYLPILWDYWLEHLSPQQQALRLKQQQPSAIAATAHNRKSAKIVNMPLNKGSEKDKESVSH